MNENIVELRLNEITQVSGGVFDYIGAVGGMFVSAFAVYVYSHRRNFANHIHNYKDLWWFGKIVAVFKHCFGDVKKMVGYMMSSTFPFAAIGKMIGGMK